MKDLDQDAPVPRLSAFTYFIYLLGFGLFIAGIYYFGTIRSDLQLFARLNIWWLLAALAAQAATYLANALSYRLFLKDDGLDWPLPDIYQVSLIMLFLNQALPSAAISGNTYFVTELRRRRVSSSRSWSVILRGWLATNVAALIAIGVALVAVILRPIGHAQYYVLGGGILVYLVLIGLCLSLGQPKWWRRFGRLSARWLWLDNLRHGAAAQEGLWRLTRRRPGTFSWSVVANLGWLLADLLTIYALAHGLGLALGLGAAALAYILTKTIALIPVSPGSLGLYEGSLTYFLTVYGLPVEAAVTVTLLYRSLSFWLPMPVGFLLYHRRQRSVKSRHGQD